MFDERTIELFKLKNNVRGDLTIDIFTAYLNKYVKIYVDSAFRCSIQELYCLKNLTLNT